MGGTYNAERVENLLKKGKEGWTSALGKACRGRGGKG